MNNSYDNIKKLLSSSGTDGKSSGLRVKFNNWKSNRWMSGSQDYVRSERSASRDVDSDSRISFKSALRGVELERKVSDFDVPLTKMASMESSTPVVRGDIGGGGGGHIPPPTPDPTPGGSIDTSPYYVSCYTHTETFNKWTKKLAVHTGVPTWKEPVDASQANDPNVVQVSENEYVKIHFGDVDYGCLPGEVSSSFDWYFFGDD